MKNLKERILKAWYEQDFNKTVNELMEKASVWKNGSIYGAVVWDKEKEKLCVIAEDRGTWTPSFVYLFRLPGNDRPDADTEELYFDLKDLDIEEILDMKGGK
jgi:hypothetical protein